MAKTQETKISKIDKAEKVPSMGFKKFKASSKAVLISFVIGIVLILLSGYASQLDDFFKALIGGSFGSLASFADFLGKLSYMIPLGLSLAVSFRIGLFNIGSAGQMMAGGLFAFLFAANVNAGPGGWIIVLIIGTVIGMLIAMLIGFLKNRFKIHEVISSIMLNWILFYILRYLGPGPGEATKDIITGNALQMQWLTDLFSTSTSSATHINFGIFIALLLIPILWFAYKKTLWGYKQELIGSNPSAGKYLGINEKREFMKAFMISGALAGLAGAIYYVGYDAKLPQNTMEDIPGYTFTGITISLLGFNSPLGVFASSILMSILTYPNGYLDSQIGSIHIVDIMIAIMIILMAVANFEINFKEKKVQIKTTSNQIDKESQKTKIKKENSKIKAGGDK